MCLESLKKNPYYLFWLGVLIGALVTGLLFAYKVYWIDSETALFKAGPSYKTQQQKKSAPQKKQFSPKTYKNSGDSSLGGKKDSANSGDPNPWNAKKGGTNSGDPNPW